MRTVRIGFMPLIDAAIPIAAVECGFAAREGLDIELIKTTSWANIRDKLIHNIFDASHMLAPLAVATSLGLSNGQISLAVPIALNANGNAITLSLQLYGAIVAQLGHAPADARESASAFRRVLEQRKREGKDLLTFGVVFPFSIHAIMVRHWLRLGGIDPGADVQFQVVPPPFMVENISNGVIDGFCVGEPWNSRAVESGVGAMVAFGSEIARCAPDKVLAVREETVRQDREMIEALVRAYMAAGKWCADPDNHMALAHMLAENQYLGVAPRTVLKALAGTMSVSRTESRTDHNFLAFYGDDINRPDPRKARWLYAEQMFVSRYPLKEKDAATAAAVFRPDLFDAATGRNWVAETADPIGLKFGPTFASDDLEGYVRALRTPGGS